MTDTATVEGVFTSFNVTTNLPKLRTDDGFFITVGVPRGSIEDVARKSWKEHTKVRVSGPSRSKDGQLTSINVETLTVLA